jgi:hypothetical protein
MFRSAQHDSAGYETTYKSFHPGKPGHRLLDLILVWDLMFEIGIYCRASGSVHGRK